MTPPIAQCETHVVTDSDHQRATETTRYRRFADNEARGRSPLYEAFARGVSGDRDTIDFLLTLPPAKRQPNLLFAAVRHLSGTPANWADFRTRLLADPEAVRSIMLRHATQTNEPARCATLLPILARLPQPLALIEVGASAGLCLLPDFYAYDYGDRIVRPKDTGFEPPVFRCDVNAASPAPAGVPRVVWRAGLDLNPLDVCDPAQAAWLETLVWPEQTDRLRNLRAAMTIAAAVRPLVVRGSLLGDDLPRLCREAPAQATLVIFHSAVLAYVPDLADRQAFASMAGQLCHTWISNEALRVFPDQSARAPAPKWTDRFLLSVNGSPVGWSDPHGAALDWIETPPQST
jgi:hypothetical protein